MPETDTSWLRGLRVAFTGRLASLTRPEAAELVRAHGGEYSPVLSRNTSFLIVGQEGWPLDEDGGLAPRLRKARRLQEHGFPLTVLTEEDFLTRLGLGSQCQGVHRLYSTAQLCRLLRISRDHLRAWLRAGLIRPAQADHGINYFDFQQVTSARTLLGLAREGVRPDKLRRSLEQLQTWLNDIKMPLAQLGVIERDGRLLVRLEEGQLAETNGQGVFDFADGPVHLSIGEWKPPVKTAEQWFEDGCRLEQVEHLAEAAEAYRQALLLSGPDATTCFNLANVLYQLGQKERAAERYREAVELDRGFSAAWNNLGNVLTEIGEPDEALDALRKAVELNPHFADAHYNLADLLDTLGRRAEADPHWEEYLRTDPSSEWAHYARKRLRNRSG